MSTFTVIGDKALVAKLERCQTKDMKKALRKGTRAGCKIVKQIEQSTMPVDTGASKGGLKIRSLTRSRKFVGTKVTIGEDTMEKFYMQWVNYGHHVGKRTGKNAHKKGSAFQGANAERKWIPGKFTLNKAAHQASSKAVNTAIQIIAVEIEKTMSI